MRNIIRPQKEPRVDVAKARRFEKDSVEARYRRMLEFPPSMSHREVAKLLQAEGWFSPKTTVYYIEYRVRRLREKGQRELREAKNACTRSYDLETKEFTEYPDHKTRLAAATLSRAYDEGTPVQRQVIVAKTFRSAEETVSKLRQSPELIQALKSLTEAGVELEVDGQVIDIEADVQKSGSETKALDSE
jgi:hypothetical protein